MPASFILVPAAVIGLIAWFTAWWFTHARGESPRAEIERLRNHAAWLEQRLDTARRERWDPDMIVSLSGQLGVACQALARAKRGNPRPLVANRR